MKWHLLNSFWLVLLVLLPLSATAEVTRAVIAVDGMSCPFCAFGVEKKLKQVGGTLEVTVSMKEGTATLVAEDGKSLDIGQIGAAVEAAGFTPGTLRITVVGTIKKTADILLLEIRNSSMNLILVKLSAPTEQQLQVLMNTGSLTRLSGIFHKPETGRPTLTLEIVEEVEP